MKAIKATLYVVAVTFMVSCRKKNEIQPNIPIPNGDFENWTGTERLRNWASNSCPECVPPFETYIVQKDSDAYHGRFDAKFIYNGVYPAWAQNAFSVESHPLSLTGYVRLSVHGADDVSIKIRLYNKTTEVDSGQWIGTSSISQYTKIVIPITQGTMGVDTAKILITGGHVNNGLNPNTTMWVDYLTLQ